MHDISSRDFGHFLDLEKRTSGWKLDKQTRRGEDYDARIRQERALGIQVLIFVVKRSVEIS